MKRLLSCTLVVFVLLINIIPCYANNPALSVGVSSYYVNQGESVTVSIKLTGDSGLSKLSFTVKFNPNEFEYVAGSGGKGGLFGADEIFNTSNTGTLSFSGTASEPVTAGGTVVSFSLKLKPQSAGGVVSISVGEAADAEGNSVAVSKSSVKLNCGHGTAQWVVTQEPTCVLYGKKERKCPCGYTEKQEVKPNDNHTFEKSEILSKPTCTKTGIEVGTCVDCGKAGAQTVLSALGHEFSEWKVTKEPTATTMGIKERVCKTCGEKEAQMVAPTGDIFDEPSSDEISTEPTTETPTTPTTQPDNNYLEIETEPTTEKNGFFGGDVKGSNVALVAISGLSVLVVGFLIAYLVLLRKKN